MATVLVVDDSTVDLRMVGGLLEKPGAWNIEFASDGAMALEKIRCRPPQLVITDLIMPVMDGLALVDAVRKEYPGLPIILMTGHGSEEIAAQALRRGASSYVPKNALNRMLVDTVERLLSISIEAQSRQRVLDRMTRSHCQFVLDNDLTMIPALIRFLRYCMQDVGMNDESDGIRISVALEEALSNAIYHGNLELGSELRELELDEYRRIIDQRRRTQPYSERTVQVEASFTPSGARFTIRDQGPGFDPQGLPDPTDSSNLERACGRGVMLMRTFMDDVVFSDRGNEVTLVKNLNGCERPAREVIHS